MKKVLYNMSTMKAPRKPKKPKLKDVFELKGTHKMPDGTIMSGKTHSKNSRVIRKAPSKDKKKKNTPMRRKQKSGY